ncbi:MAG: DUF72 domain-containing protein [Anaerolineaceae bacterium]|nr:DUF72 domain-containing protein [Anaerolineaceae bacterium]
MVDWFLGTIGFTYREWKGSFYPAGLPVNQSLNFYGKVFNAVEINTTFYGSQTPEQIARWAAATPENFSFCLKAPRRVTHDLRLVNAEAEMCAFIESLAGLGEKFGAALIQLPPSLKINERQALEKFLDALPRGPRYAVEFRHPSWHVPATNDLLRQHGVGWVATDYEDLPVDIHPTTDFLYLRWIGKHNVIPHPGYEVTDRSARLMNWLNRIQANLSGVKTIFGFFDNDYAGHAPATCTRLKELAGLSSSPSAPAEQGRLF